MHESRRFPVRETLMMNTSKHEFLTWLRQSGIINEIFTLTDRFFCDSNFFSCFSNGVDQVSLDLHWRPFSRSLLFSANSSNFPCAYGKSTIWFWRHKLRFLCPYRQIGDKGANRMFLIICQQRARNKIDVLESGCVRGSNSSPSEKLQLRTRIVFAYNVDTCLFRMKDNRLKVPFYQIILCNLIMFSVSDSE